MHNTRSLIMCLQMSRCISSSSICSNLNKQSKMMKKVMQGSRKSKKKWYDTNLDLRNTTNINPTTKTLSMYTARRMMIRDNLFMKHITDQMSMGEVANIINGNIEVTHVKITPDFRFVHAYWVYSTDDPSLAINEETLQKCAKIIRHELSQLRIVGIVPPIVFIQNKRLSMVKEVEEKLATISDVEEISEPAPDPEQMQLVTSDINAINQTLCKDQVTDHNLEVDGSIQLPMMRHDVLGLDHYKIMSQITTSLSKSKEAAQKRILINANADKKPCDLVPQEVTDFLTQKEEKEIFSNFLANRQREERQKYRRQRLLNISEEEIEESDHEEDDDYSDGYSDEFKNEVSKNDSNEDK